MRTNKLLSIALLLTFVAAATGWAAEPSVGEISFSEGKVDIVRNNGLLTIHASRGSRLFKNDIIKTDADSKAEVMLSDDSIFYVTPNSSIELKNISIDKAQGSRTGFFKALTGRMRFAVSKVIKVGSGAPGGWKKTNFSVETPTAIAGVRGTDFVIIVAEGRTRIVVFEGTVVARNITASIGGEVLIGANQSSNIRSQSPPTKPTIVSPNNRLLLNNQTVRPTIANREGAGVRDTPESVARDISAKKPVIQVAENASDFSGLTIQEVVTAALKAGADPAAVVYATVSAGFSSQQVVAAALNAGAPLNAVVSGATTAGGTTESITAGATSAGAPVDSVATAITQASTTTTSPVTVETVTTSTGTTTTVVSGGGGATPTASPSAP